MNPDALFKHIHIEDTETERYRIYNMSNGYTVINFKKEYEEIGGVHYADSMDYFNTHAPEVLNLSVDSVLVAGLGLGLMPYYLSDKCNTIDVIEIDQDLIDLIASKNYMPSNVNMFCGDARYHQFEEGKKWDVVIIDVGWSTSSARAEMELYTQKYMPMINESGFLYIPIAHRQRILK